MFLIKNQIYKVKNISLIGYAVYLGEDNWSGISLTIEYHINNIAIHNPYVNPTEIYEVDGSPFSKPIEKKKYKLLNAPTSLNPEACFRTF